MFNLYFAGSRQDNDAQIIKRKACRLYSYANEQKEIEEFIKEPSRGPLLVDSGAYSVAHRGISIDIDGYIKYINEHPMIENFIELDVIPHPVLNNEIAEMTANAGWKNYLYMIERVNEPFKILPVFHYGENLKYLRRILNFEYKGQKIPYMCIGGRHGVAIEKQEKYFETIFREIQMSNNPNIKIHVLGMTVLSALEKFPFYSADSTTHLKNAIYGTITTEIGIINVSSRNHKKDNFRYLHPDQQARILEVIHKLGYTLEELATNQHARMNYNIDYTLMWAENYKYKGPKSFIPLGGLF